MKIIYEYVRITKEEMKWGYYFENNNMFYFCFSWCMVQQIHLQRGEIRNAAIRMQRKNTLMIFKIGPFYNSLPLAHLHNNVLFGLWKRWSLGLRRELHIYYRYPTIELINFTVFDLGISQGICQKHK